MGDVHGLGALLDRARSGDGAAWGSLLERLRFYLRAVCRRQVQADTDASDLIQDVLLHIDRGFGRFRGESVPQLLAWCRQIMANVMIDRGRRKPFPTVPLPVDLSRGVRSSSFRTDPDEMAQLIEALNQLPNHYRLVIEARFFDGFRCVEIAQRIGQSAGWVRVTCKRAIERLRKELGIKL